MKFLLPKSQLNTDNVDANIQLFSKQPNPNSNIEINNPRISFYCIGYTLFRFIRWFIICRNMTKQVTPEKAIQIIWLSVASTFCWPLSINSSKTQVFVFRVLQITSIINACMLLLPLLYSAYLHFDDIITVSKCAGLAIALTQIIVQTSICFVKYDVLQVSSCR